MSNKSEVLSGSLSGETFLQDFRKAVDIASSVGELESWVLAGPARANLVEQIKQNPVVAEKQLAVDGLATLLGSKEEQERIQELIEEARMLDITRFLGYKATVNAAEANSGAIRAAAVANPSGTGMIWLNPQTSFRKTVKGNKLTSLSPSTESFRLGEYRSRVFHFTAFWEIHPFNEETGEPTVGLDFYGPRESLPSPNYQRWWAANRA